MVGHPDLLYVDAANMQLQAGEPVSIHVSTAIMPGYVVIAPVQLEGGHGVAVAGSMERSDCELVVTVTEDLTVPTLRHIGANVGEPSQPERESSIHQLYREYAAATPRLGSRLETGDREGTVVALDRERGVIVVELDTGETVEIDASQ
jgi:hypothetical protein